MATRAELQATSRGVEGALEVVGRLAADIGPRRPCTEAEANAARAVGDWLADKGLDSRIEPFKAFSSFGYPFGLILGVAFGGGLLQGRGDVARKAGDVLSLAAAAAFAAEGDLRHTPISDLFARRPSSNLVATVPATAQERVRVCLCGHLDSTRSGLLFHPNVVPHLPALLAVPVLSMLMVAGGPLLRRARGGRALRKAGLAGLAFALGMLAERELRGEDVPGASDNATGCGIAAQLAAECAAKPLRHVSVDLLLAGCEEVGMRGARAYVTADLERARRTLFLNFDTLGGDVPVTYVLREGTPVGHTASPRLVSLLEQIAQRRPELGLLPAKNTPGFPTDATVAMAFGCEAVTLLAQGDTVPNYHWPTDTFENVDPATVGRALEVGREVLRTLDSDAA